jgi:ribosomal protection tetracycline resistance protein
MFRMEAVMPLSDSMDFPLRFRSMTSGRGVYSSAFFEYRPCPEGVSETLPRKGVDPLDLQKWILYRRSAIADREP